VHCSTEQGSDLAREKARRTRLLGSREFLQEAVRELDAIVEIRHDHAFVFAVSGHPLNRRHAGDALRGYGRQCADICRPWLPWTSRAPTGSPGHIVASGALNVACNSGREGEGGTATMGMSFPSEVFSGTKVNFEFGIRHDSLQRPSYFLGIFAGKHAAIDVARAVAAVVGHGRRIAWWRHRWCQKRIVIGVRGEALDRVRSGGSLETPLRSAAIEPALSVAVVREYSV